MPVYDPMPPLARAAQNLVNAQYNLRGAQLEATTAAEMVQNSKNAGDPTEMVEAYQVLADHGSSAVAPAQADYETARDTFERLRSEADTVAE